MGVDRYRVCELYAAGPGVEGSGSGYRVGDRLVLTARHVIAPALAGAGGRVLVRPVRGARVAARAGGVGGRRRRRGTDRGRGRGLAGAGGESVLRWGELAAVIRCRARRSGSRGRRCGRTGCGIPRTCTGSWPRWGSCEQGRLDLDVASASPSAREGGSPWAGMSGAGVIADSHLVGVITVDPARYQDRLVAVPVSRLLADPGFRARLAAHGVPAEAAPVGADWYLRLSGGQTVSLAPAYGRSAAGSGRRRPGCCVRSTGWCRSSAEPYWIGSPAGARDPGRPVMLVTGGGGSGKTRLGREACVQMLVAGWDAGLADDTRRGGAATDRLQRPTLLVVDDADLRTGLISALVEYLRWDDAGPPVGLLLLARAAGDWWDRLVRQQELDDAYTVWTWTGIRSRSPTGPSTSAAPAPRSPPTAAPGAAASRRRRPSWLIRRTPNHY